VSQNDEDPERLENQMTWEEIKELLRSFGIEDDDEIHEMRIQRTRHGSYIYSLTVGDDTFSGNVLPKR
jgi:hypothetical protein